MSNSKNKSQMNKKILTTAIIAIMAILFFANCSTRRSKNALITDTGVVINGIRWATRNVDAPGTFTKNPEDFGMLFQWNRRQGLSAEDNNARDWNSFIPTGTAWYAENDPCPPGWRVPTREELQRLADAFNFWTTLNGVSGSIFLDTADNQIFLPAAGSRNVDGTRNSESINFWGFYSSATQRNEIHSFRLQFSRHRDAWVHGDSSRVGGFPVRCVAID
jgi:uncharacterized protein (TIGR02145 family)